MMTAGAGTLWRKVWDSVNKRSSGSSSSSPSDYRLFAPAPLLLGRDFERLPMDVIMEIVRMMDAKAAARMSTLNQSWRSVIVSDNALWIHFLRSSYADPHVLSPNNYPPYPSSPTSSGWDSVFFAETNLRSGYPLKTLSSSQITRELSFMKIYGQRALVPGSVIIDGGSGYCKFGWSKYAAPSGRSATFLEFGNIESPMYSRLRHFFTTIYNRMQVKASAHPVVLSLPICHYDDTESAKASRRQLKEAIYTALFDMNVPAVCAINQAALALYAARRTSGIVVNVGFRVTSIVPILHGKVMHKVGVEVTSVGASKVTGFLKEQMEQNNINFESLYTIRTLKENLCYVAYDYEVELSKNTKECFEVPGEGWFTLSKERFKAGEILFQPRLAGIRTMGLHQAVALCMDHCHGAELTADDSWFKTIVLSGGTACLPGLPERLEKELHALHSSSYSGVRVIPPPYGADTAWYGAKLIGNLSTFPASWCATKKHFKKKPRFNLMW